MSAAPLTLMAFWSRNKAECRAVGEIVAAARAGELPGTAPLPSGHGYVVIDEAAALAAMRKSGNRRRA